MHVWDSSQLELEGALRRRKETGWRPTPEDAALWLTVAVKQHDAQAIPYFLEWCTKSSSLLALQLAIRNQNTNDIVAILLRGSSFCPRECTKLLLLAIKTNSVQSIAPLIIIGKAILRTTDDAPLVAAVRHSKLECVKELCRFGPQPLLQAFWQACRMGVMPILEFLNTATRHNELAHSSTAMEEAIYFHKWDVVKWLVSHGATLRKLSAQGSSILLVAASVEMLEWACQRNVQLQIVEFHALSTEKWEVCLRHRVTINLKVKMLIMAQDEILLLLAKYGYLQFPLHTAIQRKATCVVHYLLTQNPGWLNHLCTSHIRETTPLDVALCVGDLHLCAHLVKLGARINQTLPAPLTQAILSVHVTQVLLDALKIYVAAFVSQVIVAYCDDGRMWRILRLRV